MLFRAEVEDALPLCHERIEPYRSKPAPVPRPQPEPHDDEISSGLSEAQLETPDYLLYCQPGVRQRVLLDLRRGRIPIHFELDLHGLTSDHAKVVLREFLAECRARRVRCARIIHGKGARSAATAPVLKRKLNYWLRLRADVLAFCSAPRHDGGTGALYVLLRNPNKAKNRSG